MNLFAFCRQSALVAKLGPSYTMSKLWPNMTGPNPSFSALSLQTSCCISVQDTGIGIPKLQQAQIFGRFMRADNALAWGISGTGLGLYLCRELVERHGGRLWFESEEDAGSTFFLTLPLVSTSWGDLEAPS